MALLGAWLERTAASTSQAGEQSTTTDERAEVCPPDPPLLPPAPPPRPLALEMTSSDRSSLFISRSLITPFTYLRAAAGWPVSVAPGCWRNNQRRPMESGKDEANRPSAEPAAQQGLLIGCRTLPGHHPARCAHSAACPGARSTRIFSRHVVTTLRTWPGWQWGAEAAGCAIAWWANGSTTDKRKSATCRCRGSNVQQLHGAGRDGMPRQQQPR